MTLLDDCQLTDAELREPINRNPGLEYQEELRAVADAATRKTLRTAATWLLAQGGNVSQAAFFADALEAVLKEEQGRG